MAIGSYTHQYVKKEVKVLGKGPFTIQELKPYHWFSVMGEIPGLEKTSARPKMEGILLT